MVLLRKVTGMQYGSVLDTAHRQVRCSIRFPVRRKLYQTAFRQSASNEFPSAAPQSATRSKVEQALEQTKAILSPHSYQPEIVGAYRRGVKDVKEVNLLIIGKDDFRIPTTLSDLDPYRAETEAITSNLEDGGLILSRSERGVKRYALSSDPAIVVDIHYVPNACQGAARLYLTGDDSYIRFLKLFAMEGFGVTFNHFGLWRPRQDEHAKTKKRRPQSSSLYGAIPSGISIESLEGRTESEGDRRMRETRKAMGLPEGLDLSLDLGPAKREDSNEQNIETTKWNEASTAQVEHSLLIVEGKESEADVLDMLGLVWIPPSMRTVKEPYP